MSYTYNSFGALASVTNHVGQTHRFFYDLNGRVDSTAFPGGYELRTYDDDSRLQARSRVGNVAGELFGETLSRDHRGLVTGAGTLGSQTYTGLGYLAVSHYMKQPIGLVMKDTLDPDALGRQMEPSHYDWDSEPPQRWKHRNYYGSGGRLGSVSGLPADPDQANDPEWVPDQTVLDYDQSGNLKAKTKESYSLETVEVGGQLMWAYAIDRELSRYYHGADQKLMFAHVYRDEVDGYSNSDDPYGSFEEYWYDALGRRILKRIRQDNQDLCDRPSWCFSGVERYVWDGDQILHELRATQLDASSPSGGPESQTGRVGYTHGPGIDAPLDILRNGDNYVMVPHSNWRGDYGKGTDLSGALYDFGINWPAGTMDPYLGADMRELKPWWGSLIQGKRDPSGLMYMRNRYYDPSSGQFTQEDPIGLAGGLNLYGFAGGDPINFSDPFGLCKDGDETCQKVVSMLRAQEGERFQTAAGIYEATSKSVHLVAGDHEKLGGSGGLNRDGDPLSWAGGATTVGAVYLNNEFSEGDLLITAAHEAIEHMEQAVPLDVHPTGHRGDFDSYMQLSGSMQQQAPRWSTHLFHRKGLPIPGMSYTGNFWTVVSQINERKP